LAVPLLGLPLDARLAAIVAMTAVYALVWTAAVAIIASLGRSSGFNVVASAGLWLAWVLVGPALLNVGAAAAFPAPEGLELTVRQRQGYHAGWDAPFAETMQRFYARYPAFARFPVPTDTYSHAWYYAMQHRGDAAAADAAAAYRDALAQRQAWTTRWGVLLPPVAFQRLLNAVAATDTDDRLEYLASVARYHEDLKQFFFPRIFAGATVSQMPWTAAPAHTYHSRSHVPMGTALTVVLQALIGLGVAWWAIRRREAQTGAAR
jgi:ABC-2 type transport system permease protein